MIRLIREFVLYLFQGGINSGEIEVPFPPDLTNAIKSYNKRPEIIVCNDYGDGSIFDQTQPHGWVQ